MRILYILALLSFAAAFPSPVRPSKLARRRVVVVKVHKPYPHPDMPSPKTSKTLTNTQESGTTSYEESTTSTTTSITESVTSTTSTTSETTSTSSTTTTSDSTTSTTEPLTDLDTTTECSTTNDETEPFDTTTTTTTETEETKTTTETTDTTTETETTSDSNSHIPYIKIITLFKSKPHKSTTPASTTTTASSFDPLIPLNPPQENTFSKPPKGSTKPQGPPRLIRPTTTLTTTTTTISSTTPSNPLMEISTTAPETFPSTSIQTFEETTDDDVPSSPTLPPPTVSTEIESESPSTNESSYLETETPTTTLESPTESTTDTTTTLESPTSPAAPPSPQPPPPPPQQNFCPHTQFSCQIQSDPFISTFTNGVQFFTGGAAGVYHTAIDTLSGFKVEIKLSDVYSLNLAKNVLVVQEVRYTCGGDPTVETVSADALGGLMKVLDCNSSGECAREDVICKIVLLPGLDPVPNVQVQQIMYTGREGLGGICYRSDGICL